MPAKFELRIEPTNYFRVPPGTNVKFNIIVKNIGDAPGNYEIWVDFTNDLFQLMGIIGKGTLNPGEEAIHPREISANIPTTVSATSMSSLEKRYDYRVRNVTEGTVDDSETVTIYVGIPWAEIINAPSKIECLIGRKCTVNVDVKNIGTLEYYTTVRLEDQYNNVWAEARDFLNIDEQKTFTLEFTAPNVPDIITFYIRTYTWQDKPDDERQIEIMFTTGIIAYDVILPLLAYMLTYLVQLLVWYILKKIIDEYVKLMYEAEKIYGV